MKKFAMAVLLFSALILFAGVFFFRKTNEDHRTDERMQYIISLNEIEQLSRHGDSEAVQQKSEELARLIREEENAGKDYSALIIAGLCLVFTAGTSLYFYRVIIRPFYKLSDFAENIAEGNLDISLEYERTNYFGRFTWAFDKMRREINRARISEKEAYENNKTVIASLSHDIKTPVASIRAYTEGLEAGMDTTPEKRAKYLSVIMRKCDEVTRLTNDMLLHSLSDMDKLKIVPEKTEAVQFIKDTISDISAGNEELNFICNENDIYVNADRMRTAQLLENLINNAVKYAKTKVDVTLSDGAEFAEICVRDYGNGIPDEDMPFIREKFFRGHNSGTEQGSGLGLYIAEYIAVQSGGELKLRNIPGGFEAAFTLQKVIVNDK